MYQDIDFEIIWKKIHGQTTDDEEILLSQWLNKSTSHRKYYENALRYYSSGTQFTNTAAELQKALKKINRKAGIHNSYRNTQIIAISSVAASILFFIYFQFFKPEINPNPTLTVHNAQSIVPGSNKAVLILADGSEHDLSSGDKSIIAADGTEIKNTGNRLEYISSNSQPAAMKYNTLKIPRGGEYFLILSDSTKV